LIDFVLSNLLSVSHDIYRILIHHAGILIRLANNNLSVFLADSSNNNDHSAARIRFISRIVVCRGTNQVHVVVRDLAVSRTIVRPLRLVYIVCHAFRPTVLLARVRKRIHARCVSSCCRRVGLVNTTATIVARLETDDHNRSRRPLQTARRLPTPRRPSGTLPDTGSLADTATGISDRRTETNPHRRRYRSSTL